MYKEPFLLRGVPALYQKPPFQGAFGTTGTSVPKVIFTPSQ